MDSESSPNAVISTSLSNCIQSMRLGLQDHIRLLDLLIAVLIKHKSASEFRLEVRDVSDQVASVLVPMIQAAGSSSNTLATLSEAPGLHTRDCYGISRSIVEMAANVCYIIAEGESAANRALRHARQKSHRDLARESALGDSIIRLFLRGAPDPSAIKGLQDELNEFTAQSGREKGWIDLSVDERIVIVGTKLGESILTSLHWARFMVYRHSSEILHGTLFGAFFFFGQTMPNRPRSIKEFNEYVGQQHMTLLLACVLALSALVESFHKICGFNWATEKSRSIIRSLSQLEYFQDGSKK